MQNFAGWKLDKLQVLKAGSPSVYKTNDSPATAGLSFVMMGRPASAPEAYPVSILQSFANSPLSKSLFEPAIMSALGPPAVHAMSMHPLWALFIKHEKKKGDNRSVRVAASKMPLNLVAIHVTNNATKKKSKEYYQIPEVRQALMEIEETRDIYQDDDAITAVLEPMKQGIVAICRVVQCIRVDSSNLAEIKQSYPFCGVGWENRKAWWYLVLGDVMPLDNGVCRCDGVLGVRRIDTDGSSQEQKDAAQAMIALYCKDSWFSEDEAPESDDEAIEEVREERRDTLGGGNDERDDDMHTSDDETEDQDDMKQVLTSTDTDASMARQEMAHLSLSTSRVPPSVDRTKFSSIVYFHDMFHPISH